MSVIRERAHRDVSVAEFANAGLPENLGQLPLSCSLDEQYILRMAIRVDGGEYHLPDELRWLAPMFELALEQQTADGIDHPFCYITVRHGLVKSQTDDEWHVDGFSVRERHTPEQNYVWTNVDCTEYADASVGFPDDFDARVHNVNWFLEDHIKAVDRCSEETVYRMDPYMLHRRPHIAPDVRRTFIRISFVPIEINDVNNTANPILPRSYSRDGVAFRNTLKRY